MKVSNRTLALASAATTNQTPCILVQRWWIWWDNRSSWLRLKRSNPRRWFVQNIGGTSDRIRKLKGCSILNVGTCLNTEGKRGEFRNRFGTNQHLPNLTSCNQSYKLFLKPEGVLIWASRQPLIMRISAGMHCFAFFNVELMM